MNVSVRTGAPREDLGVRSWSTQDVEPHRALAYWCDSVCHAILELGVDCPAGEPFQARLEQCVLGSTKLNFIQATAQNVARTRRAISRSDTAVFHLLHLRSGQFELEHRSRPVVMHAGDCALLDSTEPHTVSCPVPTRCLVVQFPRPWLLAWLPEPEAIVGRVLRPQSGWSAALSAAVANLRPDDIDRLSLPRGVVAEQIAALLALAAGRGAPQPSRRDQLQGRLVRALHDRYHEPGLSPAMVAQENGISKRYLHFLFANSGSTFGEQLLRIRLDSARRLLSDERFADVPIGEIAARCGFAEPSHFARCYRRHFGAAPGAYRSALRRRSVPLAL